MADKAILKFFQDHYRPFSANDVAQSHKDLGKAAIQKAIDKLVEEEKLLEKVYGKQKVYCLLQGDTVSASDINSEIQKIDKEIHDTSNNLKEAEEKYSSATGELKSLKGKITIEEARRQKTELEEEIEVLKQRLEKCTKAGGTPMSEEEKVKMYKDHDRYSGEYRKRKRICMDMINAILEGYPKTKKHLLEEVGIETDEDVGFVLKAK